MRLPVHPAPDLSPLFPELYARWMGELLQHAIPEEKRSTCSDCAMCRDPGAGRDREPVFFNPQVKCCTAHPVLPNFLVGRILADGQASNNLGRSSVQGRISAGAGVTPAGLSSSPMVLEFHRTRRADFGRSVELRCPHLSDEGGGRCSIWQNRNSNCSTFFCKFQRGSAGVSFWRGAMQPLLAAVEKGLARWCILQVGLSPEALRVLFPPHGSGAPIESDGCNPDGTVDAGVYRMLWGEWYGREEAFYRECAARVEPLGWKEVEAICGAEVSMRARIVDSAKQRLLSEELPASLLPGFLVVVGKDERNTRLWAHNPHDPIELPNAVVSSLEKFDGRPTAEVVAAIAAEDGLQLDAELIRTLVDHDVLVGS